jgi:hypothetical protein
MTFELFGWEIIPTDNVYGLWFGHVRFWKREVRKALFGVYYADGEWIINICFIEFRRYL